MRHRIRVAAMVVDKDRVLLVQHVHPVSGFTWWVPPGGGIEPGDSSIFDCARREVFEETGLQVDLSRIAYIREYLDQENEALNLEIFVIADKFDGHLTIEHVQGNGPDEHYIRDVQWVAKEEMDAMTIYPEILKDGFWKDVAQGFSETRYLGKQIG